MPRTMPTLDPWTDQEIQQELDILAGVLPPDLFEPIEQLHIIDLGFDEDPF